MPPADRVASSTASRYEWSDDEWLERRRGAEPLDAADVDLRGAPRLVAADAERALGYRELADAARRRTSSDLGFTHVELLPVMEHPFSGSWGYQVTGYFAPHVALRRRPTTSAYFVDQLHQHGIGVILDWVPAHFPRDEWALARFDGTALYEHDDPRRGAHPDWGTLVFNSAATRCGTSCSRTRSSGCASTTPTACASTRSPRCSTSTTRARRASGCRTSSAAARTSTRSRSCSELNEVVHGREPGVITAAEESTAWPGVSRPTYLGGLGFGFKWNMGWMHDTLDYFQHDPVHRRYHHHELTFSLVYACSENFILPLSHDEVVHGKGSLLEKMPGDRWQKLANLRALYAYMWAHPGKKLLFMGGELAQWREWNAETARSTGTCSRTREHAGVQSLVRDLNRVYRDEPALWEVDFEPDGLPLARAERRRATNVLAFARARHGREAPLVCVCNFSPVPRHGYRVGLPRGGRWREVLNTDSALLRRLGRRQPRRGRGRGDAVARPAVLGRADAAAAGDGRGCVPARGLSWASRRG